jgi:hypothetical protein
MLKLVKTDVPSHRYEDGKWYHTVSQSDMKQFMHCPDQHRRNLLKLDAPMQNDAALLGTVFATYPQNRINGWTQKDALDYCMTILEEGSQEGRYPIYGWNSPYLNQVTFRSLGEAAGILKSGCLVCENELAYLPKGTRAEVAFTCLLFSTPERDIYLDGCSDLWMPDLSIEDWKLSGQDYVGRDAWKFQRYDPQPAHYILGRALAETNENYSHKFTFVNIHRKKMEVQRLELELTDGDLIFHNQQILRLCMMIERNGFDDPWPLNPSDWWCSPAWCPSWNDCRGKHVGPDPWQLVERKKKALGL